MPHTGLTVCKRRWYHELATSANLHPWDAKLPSLNKHCQRELDRLTTRPRRVKLFARLKINADVVHINSRTRSRFSAITDLNIFDLELCRCRTFGERNLWFLKFSHTSIEPYNPL